MKKKQKPQRTTAIHRLATSLKALADEASKRHTLLRSKADIAKLIEDNGASIDSVADKLNWKPTKLLHYLEPLTDIPLRDLSDIATALNKRIGVKAEPTTSTWTCWKET